MTDRYFLETPVDGNRAVLCGGEAHHLVHVMRARQGDRLTLFDGSGAEYTAEISALRRDRVELVIVAQAEVDRELPFPLTLAVALPKGDRQRWLVEKAVELGVGRVVPLVTAHSVARPTAGAIIRMRRWVIDASKQCGRNRLMQIAEPTGWPDLLAGSTDVALRILAHPAPQAPARPTEVNAGCLDHSAGCLGQSAALAQTPTDRILAAIGPEGGFTDEEIAAARRAGWRVIDLGPRILRVETAAVFLAALLVARRGG